MRATDSALDEVFAGRLKVFTLFRGQPHQLIARRLRGDTDEPFGVRPFHDLENARTGCRAEVAVDEPGVE